MEFYFLSPTTFVLISVILMLLIFHRTTSNTKNMPPGPIGFPIIGSMLFMDRLAERTFAKWSQKYGPIFTVQIGQVRNVVLNSYEAIEQAFVKQGSQFNKRYISYFTKLATDGGHGILFLNDVEKWKKQRNFGCRALAGAGLGIKLEDRILGECESLCDIIKGKNEQPFVLEDILIQSVANVINGITIQERCDEEGNEKLLEYVKSVIDGFRRDGLSFSVMHVLPWVRFFPPVSTSLQFMKQGLKLGNEIMIKFIEEHEKHYDPENPRDFIDLFLKEYKRKTPGFVKQELRYYLKELFGAGTETTTSTIRWVIIRLLKHPEIQDKIQLEIDTVVGQQGRVSYNSELHYTKAVIEETYRLHPAAPLGVPRCTDQEVELMGFKIPKNTQIIPNIWWVHNDPKVWKSPEIFQPSRHIDSNGKFVKSPHIIPFSIGSRNCLGENLARMEVFLFVASILQKFRLYPNPSMPNVSVECMPGIVGTAPHYPLIIKEK